MADLRHENLTYLLNGWIYEVRRELKTGWAEEEYHQALALLLRSHGVPVQSKARMPISHRGVLVHEFECDLLVWDLIILELKVLISSEFAPAHITQLIGYLKCWQKDLGLLVNFGPTRAIVQRILWDETNLEPDENYHSISSRMAQGDREILRQVRQCLLSVGNQYGMGYPDTMYRKIIEIEMEHLGIVCQPDAKIPAVWGDQNIGMHSSQHFLIEEKYFLCVRSLVDHPTKRDFAQMKTYLNALELQFGFIANFGKQRLQIYGVNNL